MNAELNFKNFPCRHIGLFDFKSKLLIGTNLQNKLNSSKKYKNLSKTFFHVHDRFQKALQEIL